MKLSNERLLEMAESLKHRWEILHDTCDTCISLEELDWINDIIEMIKDRNKA